MKGFGRESGSGSFHGFLDGGLGVRSFPGRHGDSFGIPVAEAFGGNNVTAIVR